jgi:hypothetical protein
MTGAKMNSGRNIVLSSGRIPWVRFVIFVVHQTCFISKRPKRRLKPTLQTKVRATRATWILSLSGEWRRQLDRYVADCRGFMPRSDDGKHTAPCGHGSEAQPPGIGSLPSRDRRERCLK